jgi:hypothetical protein
LGFGISVRLRRQAQSRQSYNFILPTPIIYVSNIYDASCHFLQTCMVVSWCSVGQRRRRGRCRRCLSCVPDQFMFFDFCVCKVNKCKNNNCNARIVEERVVSKTFEKVFNIFVRAPSHQIPRCTSARGRRAISQTTCNCASYQQLRPSLTTPPR